MKNLDQMSNTELVSHIMEIGGQTGAMKQLVMMHVIRNGCKKIVENEEAIKASKDNVWSFIDRNAWIMAAKEILGYLDKSGR